MNADDVGNFFSRWSRRKLEETGQKPKEEEAADQITGAAEPATLPSVGEANVSGPEPEPEPLPPVESLTAESDFAPFMAPGVERGVKQAALKQLFKDPHFNVMDGLDIYIDDYSKSDPIPEAMLRAMTSSKFLKLFDEEEDPEKPDGETPPRENANKPGEQTVAQSYEQTDIVKTDAVPQINSSQPESLPDGSNSVASQKDHDDPHLRLQPNHAAPAPEAGRGT